MSKRARVVLIAIAVMLVIDFSWTGYLTSYLLSQRDAVNEAHARCVFRDGGKLPDPSCTPGATDSAVTQATIGVTICQSGWTARVRPPEVWSERYKYGVAWPSYGVPGAVHGELDHLVPLELGGAPADPRNLWPEPGPVPNAKDAVEHKLNEAVCWGRVTLAAAQQAIAANWTTAETKLGVSTWP